MLIVTCDSPIWKEITFSKNTLNIMKKNDPILKRKDPALDIWQQLTLAFKGIVHFEINFWYVLAYLKAIQDVGVFVSTVFTNH